MPVCPVAQLRFLAAKRAAPLRDQQMPFMKERCKHRKNRTVYAECKDIAVFIFPIVTPHIPDSLQRNQRIAVRLGRNAEIFNLFRQLIGMLIARELHDSHLIAHLYILPGQQRNHSLGAAPRHIRNHKDYFTHSESPFNKRIFTKIPLHTI